MVMCPDAFVHIVYILQGDLHVFVHKSFFSILKYVLERSTGKYGINSNFTAAEGFKHSGYTKFSDIYLCGFGVQN